jgi:hypothetical protein
MARAPLFDPTTGQEFIDQWQRLDWQLLDDSNVHRCPDDDALEAICAELSELGYLVHRLDAQSWADAAALHTALATALDFPAYYGRNLDALDDVLRDVAEYDYGSDPATTGTVLALAGYHAFAEREPVVAQDLLDIFARNARHGLLVGHPMLCLITAGQDFAPVGATPVLPALPPPQPSTTSE